ncbi:endo-1,4-beta-xylanase [Paenibacillus kribbensis]|uniref:endo-1,4-beta-xylanase n=1 Tax=Paenibacillus kribbensis TaxID=172713 RepID=UPI0015BFAD9E|nr:endo-1,4-beta-xylanase [Paenibacillus kribbensis]
MRSYRYTTFCVMLSGALLLPVAWSGGAVVKAAPSVEHSPLVSKTMLATAGVNKTIGTYGFEQGNSEGWKPRGGNTQIASVSEAAYGGTHSLKTTSRTANWNGAELDVKPLLQPDVEYEISGYVKLDGKAAVPSVIKLTVEQQSTGGSTEWKTVAQTETADTAWVKLQGRYKFTGNMDALKLYIENSNPAQAYYVDEVEIRQVSETPVTPSPTEPTDGIVSAGFEEGTTQGWVSRLGSEKVQASNADARTGSYSLLTTGRQQAYAGPKLDVTAKLQKGSQYTVSAWVKLAPGEQPAKVRLSVQRDYQGKSAYETVIGDTAITTGGWAHLSGTYTLAHDADAVSMYLETAAGTSSFYMDDFELSLVPPLAIEKDIPSLHGIYQGQFNIGTAIMAFQTEGAYGELVQKHFNSIVAGNEMKPASLQPSEGQFHWEEADKIVQFAKQHGLAIRFHTLVWHNQTGDWMFKDKNGQPMTPTPENKKLLLDRLETHIRTVAARYKNDITDWDVVNEVIDPDQPDGMRRSMWYQITGTDYIEKAFRVTREVVGPNARLFINDYNTDEPKKRDFLYNLVRDLLAKGVPIDGVGHQSHIRLEFPSISQIEQSIEKFASLGLDNQITELDMGLYSNDTDRYETIPESMLIRQAHRYRELFDMFSRQQEHISNVTIWGTDDGNTWLSNFPIARLDKPLLFDERLKAKYAYWALVDPSKVPALSAGSNK